MCPAIQNSRTSPREGVTNTPQVSWNSVTSLQFDHVTRNDLDSRNCDVLAIADGTSGRRAETFERVHRLFSVELLPKAYDDVESNDGGDNTSFYP